MRARFPAVCTAIVLIVSACQAATPSPSASPGESAAPSAATPSVAARPSLLRFARISDFLPSIHPVSLGTGNQELMADIMFSTLVDVDIDEVTILPDLATEWTVSPDAKTYTFNLNPAAVWSDGEPVTVDDVIYTISWANQNPTAFKQLGVVAWLNTAGGDAVEGTKDIPSGLKKIDDHTIEITLETADSTYLRRLAGAVYYILPEHVLGDLTAAEAETCEFCLGVAGKTPGSGPYDITTSISATGANFTAKENYWKGKDGPFKELVYKIQESNVSVAQLAAGELDLVIRVPPQEGPGLANVPGLKQLNVPGVGIFAFNFNHNNTDKPLRQAIAYAVNRPEIIEQVLGGLATLNYTIPPGFKLYDDINKYEYDPAKAKELLAQSSWDVDKTFRLALLAEDPNFTLTAPALQQYIQDNLGLKVELIALPTAPYVDLLAKTDDWDVYLSFGGSEGVGWYQSQQYYACGEGAPNYLKLTEARAECIYDEQFAAAGAVVGDEQDAILHKLALDLNENLPEIYLWQPNYLHVYSDRLGGDFGVYPNERESFQKILEWTYAP
ncbi:MAG TPA: ABC transporter substrate-binding protein [Candidatus Limnocylindrales bacterium]|nr:ABC transporter substrate-binding protein [Candidatus Limnocylindrales bacterium]